MDAIRMIAIAGTVAGLALSLNACGGGGAVAAAAVPTAVLDGAVLMNTDKTMVDHLVSATSGQDCSTLRAQKGGHYCQPEYENQPTVPAVYCYRTLAAITCYDRPSSNPGDKLVGLQPAGRLPTW